MNFGDNHLHLEVIDDKRKSILDKLIAFKNDFYLAGGTALALQIGHRISVDFDYISLRPFQNEKLLIKLNKVFSNLPFTVIQNEKDTLTILLENEVKISFFNLEYSNYFDLIETKYFYLAQVKEIAIMKLLALYRASFKDYVDIYFILQQISLEEIILNAEKKHTNFDKSLYIKALLSFDDVDETPIKYIAGFERKREEIFEFIERKTIEFIAQ